MKCETEQFQPTSHRAICSGPGRRLRQSPLVETPPLLISALALLCKFNSHHMRENIDRQWSDTRAHKEACNQQGDHRPTSETPTQCLHHNCSSMQTKWWYKTFICVQAKTCHTKNLAVIKSILAQIERASKKNHKPELVNNDSLLHVTIAL